MKIKHKILLLCTIIVLLVCGCTNFLASTMLCGSVLTFCEPSDQISLFFPILEFPDYDADPSCSIPLNCGDGGVLPPGGLGGGPPEAPSDGFRGGPGGGI